MDNARLVEEPLVNLVRRPGCPFRGDAGGETIYEEDRDFAGKRDPVMGVTPWPAVRRVSPAAGLPVLPGSRIRDGQRLRVSYYHAVTIYDNQVPCSLSEPRVFEVRGRPGPPGAEVVRPARTWFLSHDEIRVAGWSEPEVTSGRTTGQLLADNVRRCAEIVRRISPESRLCVWSDMFDPSHNAVKDFYLVRGDLAGSWEGLPRDLIVVNWNSGKPRESLPFFARRGHTQVLAGFYDAPPDRLRPWLAAAREVSGPRGVMYTTWQGDFSQLEAFAQIAWGDRD